MPWSTRALDPRSGPPNGGAEGRTVVPPAHIQWWHDSIFHAAARDNGVASKRCATNRLTPMRVFLVVSDLLGLFDVLHVGQQELFVLILRVGVLHVRLSCYIRLMRQKGFNNTYLYA
jgi:hypothetical protein